MDTSRVRILVGAIFGASLLLSVVVSPVAAACALSAPASVDIGGVLEIDGSGFPANAIVDVSIAIEGGSTDEFTTPADATGAFTISYTTEAADTGLTTVTASSGSACTADAVIAVGVEVVAETPEPTEEVDGADAAPPRTDGEGPMQDRGAGASTLPWLLASLLFLVGVGGVYATRPARGR
jgi:hypothetical protein